MESDLSAIAAAAAATTDAIEKVWTSDPHTWGSLRQSTSSRDGVTAVAGTFQ